MVTGLEVAASIASILNGFASAYRMFKKWLAKRRWKREVERKALTLLSAARIAIQGEYDLKFARLGRRFATGDGMCGFNTWLPAFYSSLYHYS
jgi:hypothetical protein